MLYLFLAFLGLTSLFAPSLFLSVRANAGSGVTPNPLPPVPPIPPVGPDRYPVPGSDLELSVDRPYGEILPTRETILCLVSAQDKIDNLIYHHGDVRAPAEWINTEYGIKVTVQSVFRVRWSLSTSVAALRGSVELMTGYPQLGTRAVNIIVSTEDGELMGRIGVERSANSVDGATPATLNGTTSIPSNLTAYDPSIIAILWRMQTDMRESSLDPTNYHVPGTQVTVSLEGAPPYGSPLPKNDLILTLTLASASSAAARDLSKYGDDAAIPSVWLFEEGVIGIEIQTDLRIDWGYSALEAGLLGLTDLVADPGGVGAVAADFKFTEEKKGEVTYGRLKLLGPEGTATVEADASSATLIEQGSSMSATLVGLAAETGAVNVS